MSLVERERETDRHRQTERERWREKKGSERQMTAAI